MHRFKSMLFLLILPLCITGCFYQQIQMSPDGKTVISKGIDQAAINNGTEANSQPPGPVPVSIAPVNTSQGVHLFVDPEKGRDANPGHKASKPKKTIQSAWDSLPDLLQTTATIHLADGFYPEQVELAGKTVVGKHHIVIEGNVSSPGKVRVSGAADAQSPSKVRTLGFVISDQRNLKIRGIKFEYTRVYGMALGNHSVVQIGQCHFFRNGTAGISVDHGSSLEAKGIDIGFVDKEGWFGWCIYVGDMSTLWLSDSILHDSFQGIGETFNSVAHVSHCVAKNQDTAYGPGALSILELSGECVIENCRIALFTAANGVIVGAASCSLINVNQKERSESGGRIFP